MLPSAVAIAASGVGVLLGVGLVSGVAVSVIVGDGLGLAVGVALGSIVGLAVGLGAIVTVGGALVGEGGAVVGLGWACDWAQAVRAMVRARGMRIRRVGVSMFAFFRRVSVKPLADKVTTVLQYSMGAQLTLSCDTARVAATWSTSQSMLVNDE